MSVLWSVRIFRFTPLVFVILLAAGAVDARAAVGFRVSLLDSASTNPLTRRPARGLSAFEPRGIIDIGIGPRVAKAEFDSSYQQVRYTVKVEGTYLYPPILLPYQSWAQYQMQNDLARLTREERLKTYKTRSSQVSGEGIAIDLPYRIKSKTFRRLFGGDNVGVRVQGNININGSLRRQKFDELQNTTQRNTNTNFNIDMIQQFTITGKVGQKVEVKVDQDSERLFDFENSLKLTYTGDEDEIIKKVEAGNVALNLGTRLATFSGRNTGLFGLKTEAKLGALSLTGIASLERGQKNRQSTSAQSSKLTFDEKSFLGGTYFWLTNDSVAGNGRPVENFRENYRHFQGRVHQQADGPFQIADIEVYVSAGSESDAILGQAAVLQYIDSLRLPQNQFPSSGQNFHKSNWRRLNIEDNEYEIDKQLGVLRLKTKVADGAALAVAFSTVGGDTFGTLPATVDSCKLILIKPSNPTPDSRAWDLMFRHVYYLNGQNLDKNNFKLEIIRKAASGQQIESGPPGTQETYLQFFDFDQTSTSGTGGPDGQVDDLPSLIRWREGEIHFLDLTPFNPSGYYNDGQFILWPLAELQGQDTTNLFLAPYLYNVQSSQHNIESAIWNFQTEFQGSSSLFDLGVLVLEGSEEVLLNGQPLKRGTDYSIDYASGQLRILSEAARAQGADLDITYESGRVFQLDKTTLLGTRAQYELWEDSYIGGMWLHLNQKTLDRRVRIGNEPIRNSLWDMDTNLKFKPKFLTRMVDALPLIQTDAPSEITLTGEVAKVYPNPNSLENKATGDYNGLAFLDDFEGSRRATPLGLSRRMWSISSIPQDLRVNPTDTRRGRLRWYNPTTQQQVPVREVYPEREVGPGVANTLQSLIMEFAPDTSRGLEAARQSWGGVMRYLGEGYTDQTRSQFLEFWIELPPRSQQEGRLVVDLGSRISEDALPNDSMDSEDKPVPGEVQLSQDQEVGNGLLDANNGEDTGIDRMSRPDPQPGEIPNPEVHDLARWNGPGTDPIPSYDDWQYNVGSTDFTRINGTEGNRTDESGGYPDTEDLDNSDYLDTGNDYYSWDIELTESSSFIVGGNPANNWRLFRIPIQDASLRRRVGAGDLAQVRWARLYITGVSRPVKIQMVQMDIVSNEWQPPTTQSTTGDTTEWISTTVINTHENPSYVSPPGVEGEIDPITNLRQREQSLVMKINRLDKDAGSLPPAEFFTAKNLFQEISLLEYKRLRMFVHGGDTLEALNFRPERYQFILRLGQNYSNITTDYYDIVTDVEPGWDPDNFIDVTLGELADMNRRRNEALADTINNPNMAPYSRFAVARDTLLQPNDSLVINGNPTLARVGFIALGVRLTGNPKFVESGPGDEIWVDELRVSDIYKDPGTAAEVSSSIAIADFITLSGGYQSLDADFHNVNTRINQAQASNNAWRGNMTLNLHKAYLEQFGVRVPLSVGYNQSVAVPRVIPGTDRRIQPEEAPDSIKARATSYNYHVQYSKAATSKSPYVRWTLEKLTASWDYAWDDRTDYNIRKSSTERSGAQATYNFPTAKGRGVAPFWWLKKTPILNKVIGNPRFYYKPTKLGLTAQGSKNNSFQENRNGQVLGSRQFNTARSLNTGFAPVDPLNIDYTRTHKGELYSADWLKLLQYDFGRTNEISQVVTNTYAPQFTSWFRPTVNYSANYTWINRMPQRNDQQSVSNQRNIGTDVTLDFAQIFGSSGGRGDRRGREGRDRRGQGSMPDLGGGMPDMPGDPRLEGFPQGGELEPGMPQSEPQAPRQPREPMGGDTLLAPVPGDTTAGAPADTTRSRRRGITPMRALGNALSPLKKALLMLDPVALSFDHSTGHSQGGTLGQAALPYQLGWTHNPGVDTVANLSGQPTRRINQDLTARSGIRITQNLRTSFNYSHSDDQQLGQTTNGTVEQTSFWLGGREGDITDIPFVDVSVDWTGLEKIAFLSKVTRTVSLQTALANRLKESWSNSRENIQSTEFTRRFDPLVGVNVSWKGDIESQVRYTTENSYTKQRTGSKQMSSTNRVAATVSYTLTTGFKLPLLVFRTLRLENQTTFSLTVDYSAQKQESDRAASGIFALDRSQSSWSVSPRMRYSFSNTVSGDGTLTIQQTKDEITQSKSRVFEFTIGVNIAIRG